MGFGFSLTASLLPHAVRTVAAIIRAMATPLMLRLAKLPCRLFFFIPLAKLKVFYEKQPKERKNLHPSALKKTNSRHSLDL
jgi:hypothetical protein